MAKKTKSGCKCVKTFDLKIPDQFRGCIRVNKDGSILIKDKFGSSIKMNKGNIEFTTPGEVLFNGRPHAAVVYGPDSFAR